MAQETGIRYLTGSFYRHKEEEVLPLQEEWY